MNVIKILRLNSGKSQFGISLQTRIPSYRLSLLENGKAIASSGELSKLARALQTRPEVLTRDFSVDVSEMAIK